MCKINICDDCPLKFTNKDYCKHQIYGNPFSNHLIIIPYINQGNIEEDTAVNNIVDIISSTGVYQLDYCIAPMLQCNPNSLDKYDISNNYYVRCFKYLLSQFEIYGNKHILLCGLQPLNLLYSSTNINNFLNTITFIYNKYIGVNYSPLIGFIDKDKGKEFERNLIKWINSAINDNYDMYRII